MDYRPDCHSYHICIRPLKPKTDTDKMNISVRSLVSAFEGDGGADHRNKAAEGVGQLPDIVQCTSQVREMEEFPMGQCEMEEDDDVEDEEDDEDLHDESPVKLLKITRKTSCYYRKAPVALPRGYKAKNCSGLLARSSSLSWEGTDGPEDDDDDFEPAAPPTRSQSMIWSGKTGPKSSTSSLMKAIHDAMQQPKKCKKTKRKAPDKSDFMKLPRRGQTNHLLDLFQDKNNRIKVEPSNKFVCTERIEDIQAKIQRWARSMASDSDGDDDGEFDEINLELELASSSSRSGTDVISMSSSPTCSQTDTEVISIILADPNEDDDFDHEFVPISGPTTHSRTEKIVKEWTFTNNKQQTQDPSPPSRDLCHHMSSSLNNIHLQSSRPEQPTSKLIPSFYRLVTQTKEVQPDIQPGADLDFSQLKVTENLDVNVNKQKLSLSKRGGLAKRRKPTKLQKSRPVLRGSELEVSEPSDEYIYPDSSHDSDTEDAHLQKVKAMGGVPTAIVTSGIKDLCVEKLRLLKVSPKEEHKQPEISEDNPDWVKAAIAIKERALAHTDTDSQPPPPPKRQWASSSWTPICTTTKASPPVAGLPLDEIEKTKNSKNVQSRKPFNQLTLPILERQTRHAMKKVVDENQPPKIETTQQTEKCLPWKSLKSSPRLMPRFLGKFAQESVPRESDTQDSVETQSSDKILHKESSSNLSSEWMKRFQESESETQKTSCELKVEDEPCTSSTVAPWLQELSNRKKSGRGVLKTVDPVATGSDSTTDLPEWVKQAQKRRERLAEYGPIEDEEDGKEN